jgi:hypothetical protein
VEQPPRTAANPVLLFPQQRAQVGGQEFGQIYSGQATDTNT